MLKNKIAFTLLFILLALSNNWAQESKTEEIDCSISNKGCLIKRDGKRLILFFRGWVSPHMANRYSGTRKAVGSKDWTKAAKDLIQEDLSLGKIPLKSSLFVLGSAHIGLTQDEIFMLLETSGASEVVMAAHSGGYKGMRATILPMPLEFWNNVTGIWMLDNFYSGASFANDLKRNFGENFLFENCYGFLTDHNLARYNSSYKSFCPKTLKRGVTHSGGVAVCLPAFEDNKDCKAN